VTATLTSPVILSASEGSSANEGPSASAGLRTGEQPTTRRPLRLRLATLRWDLILATAVLALVALAAAFPGLLTSRDPLAANPLESHLAPSLDHLAGTDLLGRDVLTRVIYGARYSILIGLGASALAVTLGLIVGLAAATGPRWLDAILSRVVDVVAAFPGILLALFFIAITGRGVDNLILALGLGGLPKYARTIRANAHVTLTSGYVEQARTFGLGQARVVLRHVLPNALGALPIMITIGLGGAIIGSSGLSFLGLGPQPPAAEWGLLLAESRTYLRQAWWSAVFPGIALTAVVISATVVGQGLQQRYERRDR
jgi:peptide/nickel transport system permease protein